MADINIKVIRVPGQVKDITVPETTLLGEALNIASMSPGTGEAVQLNGNPAQMDAHLSDNDRIIIAKGAKGAGKSKKPAKGGSGKKPPRNC